MEGDAQNLESLANILAKGIHDLGIRPKHILLYGGDQGNSQALESLIAQRLTEKGTPIPCSVTDKKDGHPEGSYPIDLRYFLSNR